MTTTFDTVRPGQQIKITHAETSSRFGHRFTVKAREGANRLELTDARNGSTALLVRNRTTGVVYLLVDTGSAHLTAPIELR